MNQELLILVLPMAGYACWWAGGRGLTPFGKGWRRFLWPILCGLMGLFCGQLPISMAVGVLAMMGAHSLGYGETAPMWKRLVAVVALGACLLPFGVTWPWACLVSGWFAVSYAFSLVNNNWGHAWTESVTGLLQGVALALAFR